MTSKLLQPRHRKSSSMCTARWSRWTSSHGMLIISCTTLKCSVTSTRRHRSEHDSMLRWWTSHYWKTGNRSRKCRSGTRFLLQRKTSLEVAFPCTTWRMWLKSCVMSRSGMADTSFSWTASIVMFLLRLGSWCMILPAHRPVIFWIRYCVNGCGIWRRAKEGLQRCVNW